MTLPVSWEFNNSPAHHVIVSGEGQLSREEIEQFTNGRSSAALRSKEMSDRRVPGVLTIGGALAVALALAASACQAPRAPHVSTLVSPDRTYLVRVSGHVTKARFF